MTSHPDSSSSISPELQQAEQKHREPADARMDKRTLEALKGSIEKWRAIEAGTGRDEYATNCPLCQLFARSCDGCPVMARSGSDECNGTPYVTWSDAQRRLGHLVETLRKADTPELVALARAEREFLESLLPEGSE